MKGLKVLDTSVPLTLAYYAVPIIGFERPVYIAMENNNNVTEVCAVLMAPPSLARELVVTLQSMDGTAQGKTEKIEQTFVTIINYGLFFCSSTGLH